MRSNGGLAPRFGLISGRLDSILGLLLSSGLAPFATREQFVKLIFDKRREKLARQNALGRRNLTGIAELPKQMVRFVREIDYVTHRGITVGNCPRQLTGLRGEGNK